MRTASKYPPESTGKTRLDRQGEMIATKARKVVDGQANSCAEYRKKYFCPRPEIVKDLLAYLENATQKFPGETNGKRFFKRYNCDEDVLEFVKFAELTRVGYRGHFAMMMLRDEFPSGYLVMETTEQGPRLMCSNYANSVLWLRGSEVRFLLGDSSGYDDILKASLVEYEKKCLAGDPLVYDVCKMCG